MQILRTAERPERRSAIASGGSLDRNQPGCGAKGARELWDPAGVLCTGPKGTLLAWLRTPPHAHGYGLRSAAASAAGDVGRSNSSPLRDVPTSGTARATGLGFQNPRWRGTRPRLLQKSWAESSHEACNHWGCPDEPRRAALRHYCCQTRPATITLRNASRNCGTALSLEQ